MSDTIKFEHHDFEKGSVLGVGPCEWGKLPCAPLPVPGSILQYLDVEKDSDNKIGVKTDGTDYGDPASALRIIGSTQWMLGESHELCAFLGPVNFSPNEETIDDRMRFQITLRMCEETGITLHSLHDEYALDPSDHIGTKDLYLSSKMDDVRPTIPLNNIPVSPLEKRRGRGEEKKDGGEALQYAYEDEGQIEGYTRERYTDVRLIHQEELWAHQHHARSSFFSDCLEGGQPAVEAIVDTARYVVVGSGAFSIGMKRRKTGAEEGMSEQAEAKNGPSVTLEEYEEEGGLAPLVPLLEKCTAHNKCVVFSLCGASLQPTMRGDLLMLLQYTDFLFINERECRRLAIIITDDPNLDLASSTQTLTELPKLSDKRPRIVVVLPNAPFPSYPMPNRAEMVVAPENMLKDEYDKHGMQMFNRYAEYDKPVHDDDQQLRNPHPHLAGDSHLVSDTAMLSHESPIFLRAVEAMLGHLGGGDEVPSTDGTETLVDSILGTIVGDNGEYGLNAINPQRGAHGEVFTTGQGYTRVDEDHDSFKWEQALSSDEAASHSGHLGHPNANVIVTALGENLVVPLRWPDMALSELVKSVLTGQSSSPGSSPSSPPRSSGVINSPSSPAYAGSEGQNFSHKHSFYYNQNSESFLPRGLSGSMGQSVPHLPASPNTPVYSPQPDKDGDEGAGEASGLASNEIHRREQAKQALILESLADHTAKCDLFIGGFLSLVIRAEAEIDSAHQKLLSEQHARSFVRETVPDVYSLEPAMLRSKRLAREREKAGVSDREHYIRTRTAEMQRRAAPREKGRKNVEARVSSGGEYNGGKGANRKGDTALNRLDKRRNLTGTEARSLFQGPESRQRDGELTSMVTVDASNPDLFSPSASSSNNTARGPPQSETHPVDVDLESKVSVRAMGVTSWGDEDNAFNEYSRAGIKWEDAPLAASLNVVTGKRLLFDAVGAGCFALEKYDQPSERPAMPKHSSRPSSRQGSPGGESMRDRGVAGGTNKADTGRKRASCDFWRLNPIDYLALLETAFSNSP